MPVRVVDLVLGDDGLRAVVAGHEGVPSPLLKAVTLSELEFGRREGGWHAHVVLDV